MIPDFRVQNFRLFRDLKIERLGRVNLIVGKNSVGKSSLLEALLIYHTRQADVVGAIASGRHEHLRAMTSRFSAWASLFPNPLSDARISFSVEGNQIAMSLTNGNRLLMPAEFERESRLEMDFGGGTVFSLSGGGFALLQTVFRIWDSRSGTLVFVPTSGLSTAVVDQLWAPVALTAAEDLIVDGLRFLHPNIDRIQILSTERVPFVRVRDGQSPIPLRRLGEGVERLFHLTLALVTARQGVLLVDEIGHGIHYSAQQEMWSHIFRLAHKFEVQVFATTHSWDCIEAFQRAASEAKEDEGVLTRLERRGEDIVAIQYSEDELGVATTRGFEVR